MSKSMDTTPEPPTGESPAPLSPETPNDVSETTDVADSATIASTDAILDVESLDKPQGPTEQELNPQLNAFMVACQEGNLDKVKEALAGGVGINDTFSDHVTGLHWAAINNRLTIVKHLCENGGDANFLGGDLRASPLHWACRNGLVYIVDYFLLNTNADPTLRDSQGYNALHLAVHSSNIILVVHLLLLCCGGTSKNSLHVDVADGSNRTSLHWAAYQGDLLTINALLRFGADVNKVDDLLFIPLHWAFMKGYRPVLKTLLEAGSNIFAKNDQGKDSFGVAVDMNCLDTWKAVLKDSGRSERHQWTLRHFFLKEDHAKLITFFTPYLTLPFMFWVCTIANGYAIPKLFIALGTFALSVAFLQSFIIPIYIRDDKLLFKSPFLAGLFSGSAFWAVAVWLYNILPTTFASHFFANCLLVASISIFTWSFFKAMFINPGYVPVPSDNGVILQQVRELIAAGQFDTDHFCINTFVRKPLRSKYSRHNKKLIARFDHYCPWVYNDIGVRNHKLFMAFVYSLAVAVIIFSRLTLEFFEVSAEKSGYDSDAEGSCLLSDDLCAGYENNPFHFNLLMWCYMQFVWIAVLCVVQTLQICKGLTTWEFSALNARVHSFNHSTLPRDFAAPGAQPEAKTPDTSFGACAKLIGLDQFILTIKMMLLTLLNRNTSTSYTTLASDIPTDYGVKQNWLDFWVLGDITWRNVFYLPIEGENNLNGQVVDYYKLYELPPKVSGPEAV